MSLEWEATKKISDKGQDLFCSSLNTSRRTVNTRPVQLKPNELTAWAPVSAVSYRVQVRDVKQSRKTLCDVCGVSVHGHLCVCPPECENMWLKTPDCDLKTALITHEYTPVSCSTSAVRSLSLWSSADRTRSGCDFRLQERLNFLFFFFFFFSQKGLFRGRHFDLSQ